jgi:arylsulfatase A-like enzyme
VCDVPVISNDFYPTILDMAGLPSRPEQHVDGVSLAPLLKGGTLAERPLYWHYPHYSNQGGRPSGSVRMGKHVLIENYEDGKLELYDVVADLSEKSDLADKLPELRTRLHIMLRNWRQSVNAQMPTRNPDWKGKP